MKVGKAFRLLVFASILLLPLSAAETFLIQNVTVHPVTSPEIANASVYVENGKITEIGGKIVKPKNVRIVEGKGLHLYPGMINSATEVGLIEIGIKTKSHGKMPDVIFHDPKRNWLFLVESVTSHPISKMLCPL